MDILFTFPRFLTAPASRVVQFFFWCQGFFPLQNSLLSHNLDPIPSLMAGRALDSLLSNLSFFLFFPSNFLNHAKSSSLHSPRDGPLKGCLLIIPPVSLTHLHCISALPCSLFLPFFALDHSTDGEMPYSHSDSEELGNFPFSDSSRL